jgi:conjugative transfer region protein (TIGR03748 family)
MRLLASFLCQTATICGLAGALLLTGCTTTVPFESVQMPTKAVRSPALVSAPDKRNATAARYGRYTLIELVPEPAQRDLMQQVVEVTIPQQLDTHVGDAMRHVLRHSGYRLCETGEAASLYVLPLPAAHLRLGPLTLRDALLVLAGPAWELAVDDAARQVCFVRNGALLTIGSAPVSHAEGEQPQEAQP